MYNIWCTCFVSFLQVMNENCVAKTVSFDILYIWQRYQLLWSKLLFLWFKYPNVKWGKSNIKHEYLRSRASTCLSLSSSSSVTSQIRDITAIEILVLTSWFSHPRMFANKYYCFAVAQYKAWYKQSKLWAILKVK